MKRLFIGAVAALLLAAPVLATPEFPPLTGRVVDNADILSPSVEADLTQKLAALEAATTDQVVVATFKSLQGYEIEEFGYQLGRRWGIGTKDKDNGAVFIIAPNERKVRIEVGYGLEPVLTDALSSTIIQGQVIPRFKAGDMEAGVVAGTEAIIEQLQRPEGEAEAVAAQAAQEQQERGGRGVSPWPFIPFLPILLFFFLFSILARIGRSRRRRGHLGGVLPWIVLNTIANAASRDWDDRGGGGWGGGGGFGGGGFSGGGGSFGGGGSSGSW